MLQKCSISHVVLVLMTTTILFTTGLHAAKLLTPTTGDLNAEYAANEVLPIQPVLLYPQQGRELKYQARNLKQEDDEIIYVQLLKRRSYRPRKRISDEATADINTSSSASASSASSKGLGMKDIFYVKALANGQFSHNRVKWYRLPEFYAISVFHKGEQYEQQNLI